MIVLVNTSFGYVIGERINSDNKDHLILKNPRSLMITNMKENLNQFNFGVGEFPWKPKVLNLPINQVSFDVSEEAVLAAYRESVTGLSLPNSGIQVVQ